MESHLLSLTYQNSSLYLQNLISTFWNKALRFCIFQNGIHWLTCVGLWPQVLHSWKGLPLGAIDWSVISGFAFSKGSSFVRHGLVFDLRFCISIGSSPGCHGLVFDLRFCIFKRVFSCVLCIGLLSQVLHSRKGLPLFAMACSVISGFVFLHDDTLQ